MEVDSFSKTHPSSLTLKGGSTAFPKPFSPQGTRDVAGAAIALPEFWYRQRSLCPQGAADGFLRNRVAIVCAVLHRLAESLLAVLSLIYSWFALKIGKECW